MTTLISNKKISTSKVSNSKSRAAIMALAFTVPFLGASFANAQPSADQVSEQSTEQVSKKMKHKGDHHKKDFSKKMAKRLALTDEQVAQMDAIKAQAKIDGAPYKVAKKEFMEKKKAIMQQATFDQTALEILQQEYQTTFAQADILRAKTQFAMMSVLTDEQKSKFEEMKNKRKNKGKGRKAKGGQREG